MTTTSRIAFTLSFASLVAACSGHDPKSTSSSIGAAGGAVTTASGITLRIPAGALSRQTEVRLLETQPRDGAMARVEVEPRDLALAAPATLTFKVEDGNVRLSEIEHGPEGEIRHELEKRRHAGEVEVEVHRGGEIEMEHGLACAAECGAGFECDDGLCKVHVEDDPATHDVGDDNGVDPAPAPGAPIDDDGNDGPGHT